MPLELKETVRFNRTFMELKFLTMIAPLNAAWF